MAWARIRVNPRGVGVNSRLVCANPQVVGVNWILSQYARGVGGILADEMGLGKTIQTLAFLSTLKAKGAGPGPHLVITPLAVLQVCSPLVFNRSVHSVFYPIEAYAMSTIQSKRTLCLLQERSGVYNPPEAYALSTTGAVSTIHLKRTLCLLQERCLQST
eukprot:1182667-Prorocentrum_minimum.AAC.1